MSRTNRATVTVNAALRQALISGQASMGAAGATLGTVGTGLGAGGAMAGGLAGSGAMNAAVGTLAPGERRAVLAEAATATLVAQGWTVTVAEGDADHYTGIEATRGDEHLLAAVGADDLITDQAGAHDCAATMEAVFAGLRERGADVTVTDDVEHDGSGGSLYTVTGAGPTRAHAIAATLRQAPRPAAGPGKPAGRHRQRPERLRNANGDR